MDLDEFSRVANNGLGRANLWLRRHPWQPHADAITHVCLHNTAYDAQCEGSRAAYAHDLVCLTDAPRQFVETTVKALLESKEYWDTHHLFHLARLFAEDGHELARDAIHEKFARADAQEPILGADQIIQLDKTKGLLFVLDRIGQWVGSHPDYWVDDSLLTEAQQHLGDQTAAIAEAAGNNPNIRMYLAAQEKWTLQNHNESPTLDYQNWSYPELRRQIVDRHGDLPRGWLSGWARHVPEDNLREAADDLLRETDPRLLTAYLRVFAHRDFPPIHQRLIDLAASDDLEVATAARWALRRAQHSAIHALVLKLVENGQADGDVIRLLARNYDATDHLIIESLLTAPIDEDDLHWRCHAAVEVFEANPDADAFKSMLQVYEQCRCSICRCAAIKVLKTRKIPDWMLEECQYDSNEDVRKLFAQNLRC